MANYRTSKLFATKGYSASATELIDINIADPISRILIRAEGLNGAEAASTHHWAKIIKKIELVDGSEVLYSLDGLEAYAMQFYQNKRTPSDWLHYLTGSYFCVTFALDFGRWLYDPEFALDPKRFNNLQLKIETDMAAGGIAPTATKFEVLAALFDQKVISPIGFLQAKRVKQYTMGSATHEYTDLPTDLKIRKLIVKAVVVGTELCQTMDNIKLSEDFDKRIIIDNTPDEIDRMYPEENAAYDETFDVPASTGNRNWHCTPSDRGNAIACGWSATAANYASTYGIVGMRTGIIAATAGVNLNVHARGFNPCSTVSIPMGDEWDPNDWLDPSGLKNLRLDLLSLAAGDASTAEILVQQLKPY